MSRPVRMLSTLGVVPILALALAACGDSVPGNAVAKVNDSTISKSTFDHWFALAVKSRKQPGAPAPAPLDTPAFKACIAAKRKALPKQPKGQTGPTDAQLKAQCKTDYDGLRDGVMQFLVQNEWLEGEAKDQGVKINDAEVRKDFQQRKKQAYPKEADYQKFLKTSGITEADILFQLRGPLLQNKIREKVTKGSNKVTDAEVTAFYNKNKKQLTRPASRDLQIVLTKGKAKADQAKAALAGGASWASVVKKYSIDPTSKAQNGKLANVTKGSQDKALEDAAFGAAVNKLLGPVKTQFGYYVFRVTRITPAKLPPLGEAKAQIRTQLESKKQTDKLDKFVKDFQDRWKDDTNCAKGFIIQLCKNAPKQDSGSSATPPGAVPQTTSPAPGTPGAGQQPQSGNTTAPPGTAAPQQP